MDRWMGDIWSRLFSSQLYITSLTDSLLPSLVNKHYSPSSKVSLRSTNFHSYQTSLSFRLFRLLPYIHVLLAEGVFGQLARLTCHPLFPPALVGFGSGSPSAACIECISVGGGDTILTAFGFLGWRADRLALRVPAPSSFAPASLGAGVTLGATRATGKTLWGMTGPRPCPCGLRVIDRRGCPANQSRKFGDRLRVAGLDRLQHCCVDFS